MFYTHTCVLHVNDFLCVTFISHQLIVHKQPSLLNFIIGSTLTSEVCLPSLSLLLSPSLLHSLLFISLPPPPFSLLLLSPSSFLLSLFPPPFSSSFLPPPFSLLLSPLPLPSSPPTSLLSLFPSLLLPPSSPSSLLSSYLPPLPLPSSPPTSPLLPHSSSQPWMKTLNRT